MMKINQYLKKILLIMIQVYQTAISPFLGKHCKHYPSCSSYAKQSLKKHNIVIALLISGARILRCNPWSLGGFDPVPETIDYKKISTFKLFGNYQTELYKPNKN